MATDTTAYKTRLAEMLTQITNELQTLGIHNPENNEDWIATPEKKEAGEADENVAADRAEDLEGRTGTLAALERQYNDINRALAKIENGTYGICEIGGEEIESDRLDANPAAAHLQDTHGRRIGTYIIMAVARVYAAQPSVLEGDVVTIEADLSRGLHSFSMVGLASKAVEEARDRVSSAIKNSGFPSPKSKNHKITVSLAPADLKKEGPLFDLPIAVAYLIAAGEVNAEVAHTLFMGELALDGTLRAVRGILPSVRAGWRAGYTTVIVPSENAEEAALIPDVTVIAARTLGDVVRHIDQSREDHARIEPTMRTRIEAAWEEGEILFEDVRGQEGTKRGLIIAAAGRHNVIMIGPPGTGKTMLARAFKNILPPLATDEALDVTAIHSVAGTLRTNVIYTPPFRAPHHTASHTSLVGGGTHPRPGEVTLAHRGVLFLDEFPEFERRSIDALRQPLEDRVVSISRIHSSAQFPADFILVAAMNPHRGGHDGAIDMSDAMLENYKQKISGPILDRIDLWLDVPNVSHETLSSKVRIEGETAQAREDRERTKHAGAKARR